MHGVEVGRRQIPRRSNGIETLTGFGEVDGGIQLVRFSAIYCLSLERAGRSKAHPFGVKLVTVNHSFFFQDAAVTAVIHQHI